MTGRGESQIKWAIAAFYTPIGDPQFEEKTVPSGEQVAAVSRQSCTGLQFQLESPIERQDPRLGQEAA